MNNHYGFERQDGENWPEAMFRIAEGQGQIVEAAYLYAEYIGRGMEEAEACFATLYDLRLLKMVERQNDLKIDT